MRTNMNKNFKGICFGIAITSLTGCTTIGTDFRGVEKEIDFGPEEELKICTFLDDDIKQEDVEQIMAEVKNEFKKFNVKITTPSFSSWKRKGFFGNDILANFIIDVPLTNSCDRNLAFIGRHVGDVVFGLLGTETLGMVDIPTHTRGLIVAERASIGQLLVSPTSTAIHESYHLFGCEHSLSIEGCYAQIKKIKKVARENRKNKNNFFPGIAFDGRPLLELESNNYVAKYVAEIHLKGNQTAISNQD